MQTAKWVLTSVFVLAGPVMAGQGDGLKWQDDSLTWARWQARLAVSQPAPLWRANCARGLAFPNPTPNWWPGWWKIICCFLNAPMSALRKSARASPSASIRPPCTTVAKMVNAYAALANWGRQNAGSVIDYVQDRRGKVIWRADKRPCTGCSREASTTSK